tara:strand:- start:337 stop:546 length:210 start_codon:yes stop_codon:yes gene_type:complete
MQRLLQLKYQGGKELQVCPVAKFEEGYAVCLANANSSCPTSFTDGCFYLKDLELEFKATMSTNNKKRMW